MSKCSLTGGDANFYASLRRPKRLLLVYEVPGQEDFTLQVVPAPDFHMFVRVTEEAREKLLKHGLLDPSRSSKKT